MLCGGYFLELTLFLEANKWTVDMGPGGCKAGERRSVALEGSGGGFKGFPQGWSILLGLGERFEKVTCCKS